MDLSVDSLSILLDSHHVFEDAPLLGLECCFQEELHPFVAVFVLLQVLNYLLVCLEVVDLSAMRRDSIVLQRFLLHPVSLIHQRPRMKALIRVRLVVLALLLLDKLHRPDDIDRARNEGEIGVLELVGVAESLHEDIQLVAQEHLYVVLPAVDVLLEVDQIKDLLNEWLLPELVLSPFYQVRFQEGSLALVD